ncbi:MAG: hypothetical protein C0594_09230, partial [Marinilabiliales bacterium]
MSEKLNIILNGKKVTGEKGETILTVAKRNGIEIPTLCHDPRLEPYSSCFVCVVEVEGMKGLQPACSTRINEGMTIHTHNEKVKAARKTAIDLIVSNHYADCVAPCKETCPAGVDVQGYISLIEKGLYSEAVALIKETNPLPAICGRVCVRPCEAACRRNLLDEGTGVGIDYMKRFAADFDLASATKYIPKLEPKTGKKVAVIGAGPGGLASAWFLQQKGHQCDIYEGAPAAGGWLRYGIPEYRLPNDLLQKEVDNVTELGVNIFYNKKLGDNLSYKELNEKYDATILCIGSQRGTLLGCDGEDADGVYSGIDFLRNMEITGQKYDFSGKKVVVVGGGNTAMDCCRTSIRCGSTDVKVVYRRTEKEMPANPIEIHESKLENVEYLFLNNPVRVNKDENGKLKSMTLVKMELGEPDASGRRRPVPVEGSEYDIEVDYILAAIGQKTEINFLDDINKNTANGELKPNRWGDIDADQTTLQTGIPNVFAAGDGVTGPATLIEAVGQAKIASRSCHQYLSGEELKPEPKEFISRKDNFREQTKDEYVIRYQQQMRHEMPTLDPAKRLNFDEVELGYENENVARTEANRCLECGCVEYFTCDLKKHADEYGAEQNKFEGDFNEYNLDFSHPYIEIDNNKCVLCSRCVRICKEVVGAGALGLVNRGFDTYVAPAMGESLTETDCESCGMCISACPTAAISENVLFKPGPVKMDTFDTVCNFCSVGCEITVHHKGGFVMRVTGKNGNVNKDGNLCRFGKFGYRAINDAGRITKPLMRVNGKFEAISFDKAFDVISEKVKSGANKNAFFAGARLSNEDIYLVQKLARQAAGTNNISSFHYLYGGEAYANNSMGNVPFDQIKDTNKVYLLGSEINMDNGVVGFMINSANVPVELITEKEDSKMKKKVSSVCKVDSYYNFVKAANHYLLSNGMENAMFIGDNCEGFEEYKKNLLAESYEDLCKKACGCQCKCIENFAKDYNKELNAIIVFSEKEISAATSKELFHLAMITGKLGKTANGLVSLKEKNNAQGIFDMGARPYTGVGGQCLENKDFAAKLKQVWKMDAMPAKIEACMADKFDKGEFSNLFIFGEDPVGCAVDKNDIENKIAKADFVMVQDYFMTATAEKADLILPASLPYEMDGSFTNTQKVIQEFEKGIEPACELDSTQQIIGIMKKLGVNGIANSAEAKMEAIKLL